MEKTVDLVERKKLREIEEHIQFLEGNEEDEEDDFTVPIMFLVFIYFTINY